MRILTFDIESCTGNPLDGSLCSFGYVLCENGVVAGGGDILCNPLPERFLLGGFGKSIGLKLAYPTSHFRRQPRFDRRYCEIKALFDSVDLVLGFAVQNDLRYLNNACDSFSLPRIPFKFLDVQLLGGLVLPEHRNHGLKAFAEQFNIEFIEHRSDEDARVTYEIFARLVELSGKTLTELVERYGITRAAQDEFAINSQKKAIAAQDAGKFKDEIVPITVRQGKKEFVFENDEYINRTTSLEKLSTLRPAFKADGSVTAGNASGINDGASFVVLASEEAVEKYNLTPMAEVIGIGQGGVDPSVMGLGPVPAVRNALKNAGMKLSEMELLELNEAFAAQSLGVVKLLSEEHGESEEDILARCNVNGGAIALGHPVGASGNRIIVTLAHELKKSGKTYGLASLCIGGGMGTAVILKNIK